ncbi:hypothetical protein AX16_008268 [Volvariella volvacea WC 439]|nr:hypothetical protein AX16_008268 [Volvariella volvacea WC 439]
MASSPTRHAVQRAWIIVRQGTPAQALTLKQDHPVPSKLEAGEVLVRVQAAALNPVGWKLMKLLPNFIARRPFIAEHDFSGVIADPGDSSFAVGDGVLGFIPSALQNKTKQGALAEYVRVPASYLIKRPATVTPVQAAGITLVALTSWQALIHLGHLEEGQSVFVNGGSSSVGAFAIQIAKAKGAKVTASASAKNEGFVRKMGADEFIDYTAAPLHQALVSSPPSPKFHIIFDAVGLIDPALFTHSPAYLAPGGVFITSGPMPHGMSAKQLWLTTKTAAAAYWPRFLGGIPRAYHIVMVKHSVQDLHALEELLAQGKLTPIVDSVYEFEDVLKAYERIMSFRATGKVVVKVDESVD